MKHIKKMDSFVNEELNPIRKYLDKRRDAKILKEREREEEKARAAEDIRKYLDKRRDIKGVDEEEDWGEE